MRLSRASLRRGVEGTDVHVYSLYRWVSWERDKAAGCGADFCRSDQTNGVAKCSRYIFALSYNSKHGSIANAGNMDSIMRYCALSSHAMISPKQSNGYRKDVAQRKMQAYYSYAWKD